MPIVDQENADSPETLVSFFLGKSNCIVKNLCFGIKIDKNREDYREDDNLDNFKVDISSSKFYIWNGWFCEER